MSKMSEGLKLGAKVRSLRRREGLSQVQLADKLGISPSYLNLIESNRRPLPAALLIKLAQTFQVDLHSFGSDEDARPVADLLEAFSDPMFESYALTSNEMRELATASPQAARGMLALYRAYRSQRASTESLAARITRLTDDEQDLRSAGPDAPAEVNDFTQKHMNHFPELEDGAEELWKVARLERGELIAGLVRHLAAQHGVTVRI